MYLEGTQNDQKMKSETSKDIEEMVKEKVPVSVAKANVEDASVQDILDVAKDPRNIGTMITTDNAGFFDSVKNKMQSLAAEFMATPIVSDGNMSNVGKSSQIIVNAGETPEVIMVDSLLKSNVSDHLEPSYYVAMKKAFDVSTAAAATSKATDVVAVADVGTAAALAAGKAMTEAKVVIDADVAGTAKKSWWKLGR